jgi:hypothetical protein
MVLVSPFWYSSTTFCVSSEHKDKRLRPAGWLAGWRGEEHSTHNIQIIEDKHCIYLYIIFIKHIHNDCTTLFLLLVLSFE